jgi:hypothetical protein
MSRRRWIVAAWVVVFAVAGGIAIKFLIARKLRDEEREQARAAIETKLLQQDVEGAQRDARAALETYPDDARLHVLLGLAHHARARYGPAADAFDAALTLESDEAARREIRYLRARSVGCRFLETRSREDFNRAAGDLRATAEGGGPNSAEAKILLGLALAEPTPFADPKAALPLLEDGLAAEPRPAGLGDPARIESALARLKQGDGAAASGSGDDG